VNGSKQNGRRMKKTFRFVDLYNVLVIAFRREMSL